MRFNILSVQKDAELIKDVRKSTLQAIGAEYSEKLCAPLPHGVYLSLENEQGILGVVEGYLYKDHYKSMSECPFIKSFDEHLIKSYSQFCHIRTVYVYPEFRKASFYYLYLIIAITQYFCSNGAPFATAITSSEGVGLNKLYEKTGGVKLAPITFPGQRGEWSLFSFRGEDILANPFAKRVEKYYQSFSKISSESSNSARPFLSTDFHQDS